MTCPTARARQRAEVERARAEILAALAPLMVRHGTSTTIAATAHAVGDMIGMARLHGQLGGTVAEQMGHVQTMVGLGVRRSSAAVQPPEGRA